MDESLGARVIPSHRSSDPLEPGFEAFYVAQYQPVLRLAVLLVRSRSIAEELTQEAFVRLYERFPEVTNPGGYVRTIVVRLASTWHRRQATERLHAERPPHLALIEPMEHSETWEAIGRLRPERAVVLALRFYEDLPHDEIGAIVGCSAATVRSRVRRALADLRRELEE